MYRIFLVLVAFLFVACAPPPEPAVLEDLPTTSPTRTPGGPTLTPISFIPPGDAAPQAATELVRFEGQGAGQSESLRLDSETTLRVHWEHYNEEFMQVFIVNTDPNQADPRYTRVAMALSGAPSFGYTDYTLITGEYRIEVLSDAGDWLVWVESITP